MEAQSKKINTDNKLSPEERLDAILSHEALRSEIASLAIIHTDEASLGQPDQIRLKATERRIVDIKDKLGEADVLTSVLSDYDHLAGSGSPKLDIFDRKLDIATKGMSQQDMIGLYGAIAAAYGESSPILKHIADKIDGNNTDEPSPSPEKKESNDFTLPETFAEAKARKGHSIEDYVQDLPKIDGSNNVVLSPLIRKISTHQKRTPDDKAFFKADKLRQYESGLVRFADKMRRENKYEYIRSATRQQFDFLEFDSKAFIDSRVERRSVGAPNSRIYLNPQFQDILPIYEEILTEAEQQGLRFKSKVFDLTLRRTANKSVDQIIKTWEDWDSVRIDPIVIYGYEDSQDALLKIVNEVYRKHADSFKGRRMGQAPIQVAPGFALGAEPTGFSGQMSLMEHRYNALAGLLEECRKQAGWKNLREADRKKLFCRKFRENVKKGMKHNIDPSNIAFDLEVQPTTATLKTPEQERQPSLKERYDLPGGFRTEKGSVYRYSESGETKRHKFDHTERGDQRMGIAVFYPDIPAYRDIITRIGAEQGHMPKNKQRRGYIIEDDSKAPQGYRRVYDIARANNPQNLHFALIKNDGTIDGRFPVSIIPQKGLYVFEMGRDKRGRTIRHPGHKVTEILEKDEDVIRAWGKLAKQAKK